MVKSHDIPNKVGKAIGSAIPKFTILTYFYWVVIQPPDHMSFYRIWKELLSVFVV